MTTSHLRFLAPVAYLAAIVTANVVTATQPPITFDWLGQFWVVTWGTFAIAATFLLRDAVQVAFGRSAAYATIGLALGLNAALSLHYGDLAWITAGSVIAFALSETLDTEVFTRWRGSISSRVAISGVLGGTLDSVVFAVVALSPLTTGIVPWEFLWTTIVAQVVVKSAVNLVGALAFSRQRPEPPRRYFDLSTDAGALAAVRAGVISPSDAPMAVLRDAQRKNKA